MLLPLPAHPFETTLVRPVRTGKQPYVSFDRNRYSIPHTLVQRPVTLLADATTVRVVDGADRGRAPRPQLRHRRGRRRPRACRRADGRQSTRPARSPRASGCARPCPASTGSSSSGPRTAMPASRSCAACSICSTTTAPRRSPPPSPRRSRARRPAPAPSRTCSISSGAAAACRPRSRSCCPNHPGVQDLTVQPHALETYDALSPDRRPRP